MARSTELTAAVGLLAGVVALGLWGGDLMAALVALVRESLATAPAASAQIGEVAAHLRLLALRVGMPLGAVLGSVLVAMVTAHQLQVGGLWVPGLLAPSAGRLWGGSTGLGGRLARGGWALAKASLVIVVAGWTIGARLPLFARLGTLEPATLVREAGGLLQGLAYLLATATLALGLGDFILQYRRMELMLRLTPQEQREDQRAEDGDPALRARRRRLVQTWQLDPAEILPGAALALTGSVGLTVVLAGGPPPRRILVRGVSQGSAGMRLRQAAARAGLPCIEAPEVAYTLSRRPAAGAPLPAPVAAALAALWPGTRDLGARAH